MRIRILNFEASFQLFLFLDFLQAASNLIFFTLSSWFDAVPRLSLNQEDMRSVWLQEMKWEPTNHISGSSQPLTRDQCSEIGS